MLSFSPEKNSVNKAAVLLFKVSLGSFLLLSPHSCSWTMAEVGTKSSSFLKTSFILLFIFGSAGSSLLHGLFCSWGE